MMVKIKPEFFVNLGFDADVTSEVLTTETAIHHFEPGMRLTLGNVLGRDGCNRDHSIEYSFLGLLEWKAVGSLRSANPDRLFSPLGLFNVPGFDGVDVHRYEYWSDFDSHELTFRVRSRLRRDRMILQPDGCWMRHSNPGWIKSLYSGIRFISLDERFLFTGAGSNPAINSGALDVRTGNDLFGLQVGVDCTHQQARWNAGFSAKAGGFYNHIYRRTRLQTVGGGLPDSRSQDDDDHNMSFATELKINGAFHLMPHVSLRTSYEFMFVQGIALATENISLRSTFPTLDLEGHAIYHSLNTGIEIVW